MVREVRSRNNIRQPRQCGPVRRRDGARPMRIERRNTTSGQSPYAGIDFRLTTSEIRNPDGSVVFRLENVEVPDFWSQVASDVLAQKYFRKAGVAARLKKVEEETVPSWLWRSVPDTEALAALPENERYRQRALAPSRCSTASPAAGPIGAGRAATSPRKKTRRPSSTSCATCWPSRWSRRTRRNGSTPGCTGPTASMAPARATITSTFKTGKLTKSKSAYEHPQPHACFIQGIEDDLVNEGGIMDLWVREARLFKYGSGTGSNFSRLRGEGERLSGGGRSSRPDELPQDRRPRRGRDQVAAAPRAARPRWSWSTPTIPISRPISTGR